MLLPLFQCFPPLRFMPYKNRPRPPISDNRFSIFIFLSFVKKISFQNLYFMIIEVLMLVHILFQKKLELFLHLYLIVSLILKRVELFLRTQIFVEPHFCLLPIQIFIAVKKIGFHSDKIFLHRRFIAYICNSGINFSSHRKTVSHTRRLEAVFSLRGN